MNFVSDVEYDLMSYCIKYKGRWWVNHWFRNKEVNDLYSKLRSQDLGTVIAILGSDGPDYQKHIAIGKEVQNIVIGKENDSICRNQQSYL